MRFCGWLECVIFGLLLLTCKIVAWNDWMKQVWEMNHNFKCSFLAHAEVMYYTLSVIWKLTFRILRLWFWFVSKDCKKSSNIHSKLSFARGNENLWVAPISIVLNQSGMNDKLWVVHQMKVEEHIFPLMYNS